MLRSEATVIFRGVPLIALAAGLCGCGSGSAPDATTASLNSQGHPSQAQISPRLTVKSPLQTALLPRPADAPPAATLQAASRLLDQATFGPTHTDIANVQSIGLNAWLAQQFSMSATIPPAVVANPKIAGQRHSLEGEFFSTALTAPDQLRQRVAFALSEIFVVSSALIEPQQIGYYRNMLITDAFGNFQTLLRDVTLSPAMGNMLNMMNSAAPAAGQLANENYARECMQLFSIGLGQLNPDGTPVLDGNGNPIPTYTAAQVQDFARALTGWTYAQSDGTAPSVFPNATINYNAPMAAVESAHDTGAKTVLNGTMLPAGQTAEQDLDGALGAIFAHPNVGPFLCRQLIQHLVMSNPSPSYVARIAAVFNDDGTGVRGNLQAVIQAILLDHKARLGDTLPGNSDAHLREPILWLTAVYRGLGFSGDAAAPYVYGEEINEPPYGSSSVFNFFPPDYVVPGTEINAPEFAIENAATVLGRLNLADEIVSNTPDDQAEEISNEVDDISIDLSATSPLGTLAANPPDLVDAVGTIFMHGQMPADMRQLLIDTLAPLTDPAQRARFAVYLVITSSQYKDMH